jgi:hypothetical protein
LKACSTCGRTLACSCNTCYWSAAVLQACLWRRRLGSLHMLREEEEDRRLRPVCPLVSWGSVWVRLWDFESGRIWLFETAVACRWKNDWS